jgi:NAD(P)-dependent dehydrogenase (short-subunit alcohol dehydrogenase family)
MEKRVALITGGTSGIGFAIAEKFAQQGINIIIISSSYESLDSAATRLSIYDVSVTKIYGDLSDAVNIPDIIKRVLTSTDRLDFFVNNAGLAKFASIDSYKPEDFDVLFDFNVKVPFLLIQAFVPLLRISKGSIVNISTYWAHKMIKGRHSSLYSASRGAMVSMVKALANELSAEGIRINAVAPGSTQTETFINWKSSLSNDALDEFEKEIKNSYPIARLGEPFEIANAVFFLLSDQANWITGQILNVDGGFTIR